MTITLRSAKGQALTHNELDANFTTLQTADSDHAALTAAHGVTGDVVGTTDTQTLTNKTLTSPSIGSGVTVSSGNIVLSGVAQKIIGDFSNATFANRPAFQTSTTNSATGVMVVPNGTSQQSLLILSNDSSATNGNLLFIDCESTQAIIQASVIGTGSAIPIIIRNASGQELLRFDTSGESQFKVGKFGYGSGAGGTVTQLTSKSTAVTLNKPSGQITMHNASLAANTAVGFNLSNNTITSNDVLIVNLFGGGTWVDNYTVRAGCFNGGAKIVLKNETAGALAEAVQMQFAVIKGAVI